MVMSGESTVRVMRQFRSSGSDGQRGKPGGMRAWMLFLLLAIYLQPVSSREPGKLLLTMLIKNEREHLSRSLPKWAPLIDYWIIGIDSNNTDDSSAIIDKHLKHIPGELMVVEFDGMGPTWTKIVERGLVAFPNATHGILSDADFTPSTKKLDKMQLDVRCSKHMFNIRSAQNTVRKMDWIYRNIPGAKVERRTHQALSVPELPGGHPYMTQIDLEVVEYEGGYQDRNGNKSGRYIQWLEKDLEELPGDGRSLYYLGHGHLDLWTANPDYNNPDSVYHLGKALEYMEHRTRVRQGYFEERYFAMSKAAEICERYTHNYTCSIGFWKMAQEFDPDRADTYFYIAQHYNLMQQHDQAYREIIGAMDLSVPRRSLFLWMDVYQCLRHRELARAVKGASEIEVVDWKMVRKVLPGHMCKGNDASEIDAVVQLAKKRSNSKARKDSGGKREEPKGEGKGVEEGRSRKDAAAKKHGVTKSRDRDEYQVHGEDSRNMDEVAGIQKSVRELREWGSTFMLSLSESLGEDRDLGGELSSSIDAILEFEGLAGVSCSKYLPVASRYFDIFTGNKAIIRAALMNRGAVATGAWFSLVEIMLDMMNLCRQGRRS